MVECHSGIQKRGRKLKVYKARTTIKEELVILFEIGSYIAQAGLQFTM